MAKPDQSGHGEEKKVLVRNRKAHHEYVVEEQIECGIELRGSEVKSIRDGRLALGDAWAGVRGGQCFLHQLQINEYPQANRWNHEPKRDRRLLLHRKEIDRLDTEVSQRGRTLVPLELYLKGGRVKVLLGLCRGKQTHDKREVSKARDSQREIDREMAKHRR